MARRKTAIQDSRKAIGKHHRSDEEVSRLVRTALAQCLTQEDVTVRQAARSFGVAKSTVERWKKRGFVIHVLRSRKLAACFLKNLRLLVAVRNGRVA